VTPGRGLVHSHRRTVPRTCRARCQIGPHHRGSHLERCTANYYSNVEAYSARGVASSTSQSLFSLSARERVPSTHSRAVASPSLVLKMEAFCCSQDQHQTSGTMNKSVASLRTRSNNRAEDTTRADYFSTAGGQQASRRTYPWLFFSHCHMFESPLFRQCCSFSTAPGDIATFWENSASRNVTSKSSKRIPCISRGLNDDCCLRSHLRQVHIPCFDR
jgi:hypothetical protein